MELLDDIPTDLVGHIEWRLKVHQEARRNEQFRKFIWQKCSDSLLFFISAFCQIYEPRRRFGLNNKELPKVIPFIPWPHQAKAIEVIDKEIGIKDVGVDKARGEGASWIGVATCVHRWVFHQLSAIGVVSKDEAMATDVSNPDSLFWKIEFVIKRLPNWMRPNYRHYKSQGSFVNEDNGSVISGYACTGDVASGGRKLFFLMDELAKFPRGPDQDSMTSTLGVTDSRLIVSTFKGTGGAYYRVMREEDSDITKINLMWQDNPTRNRGLYRYERGALHVIDPFDNPPPLGYEVTFHEQVLPRLTAKGFRVEGTLRSPWYDALCMRPAATPEDIAQDYDRNPFGVEHKPFQHEFMERVRESIRPPDLVGKLVFASENPRHARFEEDRTGPLKLWIPVDRDGRPAEGVYGVACDIGQGVGLSNSVATGINLMTGSQAASLVTNRLQPGDFSRYAQALAWWLYEAQLSWEVNGGTGTSFLIAVEECSYANVWKRETLKITGGSAKKVMEVGWWNGRGTKLVAFEDLDSMVRSGRCKVFDQDVHKEFPDYIIDAGKLLHRTLGGESDGGAHGDRVVSLAIAGQMLKGFSASPHTIMPVNHRAGTVGHRRHQIEMERAASRTSGDDFRW